MEKQLNVQMQNEQEVTKELLSIIKLLPIVLFLSLALKLVGIFTIDWFRVMILVGIGLVSLALPFMYAKGIISQTKIKYYITTYFVVFVCVAYSFAYATLMLISVHYGVFNNFLTDWKGSQKSQWDVGKE